MNPRALGMYWYLTVATLAFAIAAPAFFWIPLAVFGLVFIYSIIP